jgi:hypothetical protein
MLDFAMAALALQIAAAAPLNTPAPTGIMVAQGRGNSGNVNRGGGNTNSGLTNTNRNGVDCTNPVNAAHPNCSDNSRSNSGGTQRGDNRSDQVQQLNLQNGPIGGTSSGHGRTHH